MALQLSTDQSVTGVVTVMFTDVARSTELATSRGDAAAREMIGAHAEIVRRCASEHEGRELKGLGDGLMLAFSSPRKAVSCAVEIQRAVARANRRRRQGPIAVRIGLNTGEVIHEAGDVFGEAVSAASRITAKASADEVLVSEAVRQIAGTVPGLSFADRGRFRLKGFPDRWHLYRVVWERDAAAAVEAPVTDRPALAGRASELAELLGLLERARAGHGSLVMLGGEPGIGKTRLIEELLAEAERRGALALAGRCYETDAALPYIPVVEILEAALDRVPRDQVRADLGESGGEVARIVPRLRRVFPDLPPPVDLPAEQERRYLFANVREFVERASSRAPLVLVFDDLQWADASTLLLIEHMAERVPHIPVLGVGAYRDVELEAGRPLAETLTKLIRRRLAQRIRLRRLPRDGVVALLRAISGREPPGAVVDAIEAETEGNPFFVEEVYRHLAEEGRLFDDRGEWRTGLRIDVLDVPESVRLVIGWRLRHLSEPTRQVLAAAAVLGRAFDLELLSAMSERDADSVLDAVDEAERARILVARGQGRAVTFAFAHELIRQTLLGELSTPRRQRRHLRAADALERLLGPAVEERAAEVAVHLYESGAAADPARTAGWLRRAAGRALAAAAYEDALRQLQLALEVAPEDDALGRGALLEDQGLALRGSGRWAEAMAAWEQALATYERLGAVTAVGRLCTNMAMQLNWAGRQPEAVQVASRGLAAVEGVPEAAADRAYLLGLAAVAFSFAGNHEIGEEEGAVSLRLTEELGDPHRLAQARSWLAFHKWFWQELDEVTALGDAAAAELRAQGAWWDLANILSIVGFNRCWRGDIVAGLAAADEGIVLARRTGHLGAEMACARVRIIDAALRGDLAEYAAIASRDRELAEAAGLLWAFDTHVFNGVAELWRGDWEAALAEMRRGEDGEFPSAFAGAPAGLAAVASAQLGDHAGVMAILDARRGELVREGVPALLGFRVLTLALIEALFLAGAHDEAASLAHVPQTQIRRGILFSAYNLRLVQTTAGIASAAARRWDDADDHFRIALRQADELPHRIEHAEARRLYAAVLVERAAPGDRERARTLLGEALTRYRELGMRRHAAAAAEALRAL